MIQVILKKEDMEHLLQQPRTLENMALGSLREWIITQGKRISDYKIWRQPRNVPEAVDLLNEQIELTRVYLRKLPPVHHNKLAIKLTSGLDKLERTPGMPFSQKMFVGRMIETIYSERLTSLSLCSQLYFASLSKSYLLTGLVELTFAPTTWLDDDTNIEHETIQFLKDLHNLKFLNLSYCSGICNINNVLQCIVDNCKSMERLNLCYLECFDDDSIDILCQLKYLRRIDVRDTAISERGIAKILMCCPDMEHIITDDNEIALALELIASCNTEDNVEKKFNLLAYENCLDTTLEQLQLVVKMCPNIRKVSLTRYEEDISRIFLTVIKDLEKLRKLELYAYNFYEEEVFELLQERGRNLVYLLFEDVAQIDLNALITISETCPNLERFCLEDCLFGTERRTTVYGASPSQNPIGSGTGFNNIKNLTLRALGDDLEVPTDEQLFFLLSTCLNVELIIASGIPLSDDLLLKVLDVNPMVNLEQLRLRQKDRPRTVVLDRIVQSCTSIMEVVLNNPLLNRIHGRRRNISASDINASF